MLVVKLKRSRDAPFERPMLVRSGHASSTYLRKLASALGAGSVATTSKPRARYWAAQLAPMTPVPTMAIRWMGLLKDITSPLVKVGWSFISEPERQRRASNATGHLCPSLALRLGQLPRMRCL